MVEATKVAVRPALYTAAVRRRLAPELLVASRLRGYCQSAGNVAVYVALLFAASAASSAWQFVVLYVAIGFALHRLFFPVHDCIHYSLFPTKLENRVVGAFLSALLGTSFDAIRDQHLAHHRDFGCPDDPGAADYFPRFRSRRRLVAFLLGPLVGTILFAKIGDYLTRPSRTSAADEAHARPSYSSPNKSGVLRKLIGYAVILSVQAAVCALLTGGFQPLRLWRYAAFNVLPAATVFLFLVRLRMFLEHGALNYAICDYHEGKRPTARTIYASRIERLLLCGSDFNFHHEHHLYPVVPGWQLPKLHRELLSAGLDAEDVRQTYFQALREVWRNLATGDVRTRRS